MTGQGKIQAEAQRQRKSRACWSVVLGGQTCRLIPAVSFNLFCLDRFKRAQGLYRLCRVCEQKKGPSAICPGDAMEISKASKKRRA